MHRYLLSTALLVIAGVLVSQSGAPPAAQESYPHIHRIGKLPVYFIENQGQTDHRVAYYVQGRSTSVYFSPAAVTFLLRKPPPRPATPFRNASLPPEEPTPASTVKLEFLNANPNPRIEPRARTEATINYFRGPRDQWRTALPTYGAIVYREVWPGIDVEFAGPDGNLKYTFLVHPGADPKTIRFAYRGASSLTLTPDGRLDIVTPTGGFSDDIPVSWQEGNNGRQPVQTAFTLHGEEVRFDVGAYDRSRDLFIDPVVLTYSGFLGGSGDDYGRAIAVDAAGNAYITGNTHSANFPTAAGPDTTHNGDTDAFVAKINSSGTALVYSGFLGGSSSDLGYGIAVDTAGNAYVTGETLSANFPTTAGLDVTHNGGWDAFVAKVNSSGTALAYSGFLGGSGADSGYGITVDTAGNAYVTGSAGSLDFPTATGPDTTFNFSGDAFVAKVNPAGTALVYSGFLGGSSGDSGHKIAVDATGNAYVTGYTQSANFPTTAGSVDTTHNGGWDAFVAKVNSSGTALVYSGFLGGVSNDIGYGIAVDPAGNAYVTGSTFSANFPTTASIDTSHNDNFDAFVAKVHSSGTALVYSGFLGGAHNDWGYGIAIDTVGNVYVTGRTESMFFPRVVGPDMDIDVGGDAFVTRINPTGTALFYSGFLGGSGEDAGLGIAAGATGSAYVTGYTAASNFPSTVGPPPPSWNAFVTILGAFPATAGPVLAFRNSANAIETNTFPTSTLRNAGGTFRLNPALALSGFGRAFFAARDSSVGIWLNFLNPDDTYNGWTFAGGNSPGNPDVATTGETAWIAIRDPWNSYWVRSYFPGVGFNDWTWLQGILATDPKIAGCPNGDVYITGKDNWNGVWTRRYAASFPGWQSWRFAGGIISGSPAITCGSDSAAYIATRDPSNNMWLARVAQESLATWHYGGGIFDGDPQIVSNGGFIHVFGLSSSVPWYRTWQIGTGWLGWTSPGGVLTHFSPAVYGGNLFIAGQSANGDLWWWNGLSNSWTNFGNKSVAAGSRLSAGAR